MNPVSLRLNSTINGDVNLPDIYVVEILTLFDVIITHSLVEEMEDADGDIPMAFENLADGIQQEFSERNIQIYLDCVNKINAENSYKLSGSIKRCYEFDEKGVDGDELIDGTFDIQLKDMKSEVEGVCDTSCYDIILEHFDWADDEVIEKVRM